MGARGMGRLYLRGGPNGVWWFALGIGGEKVRLSTGLRGGAPGKPPRDVEIWRARKLVELGQGVPLKAEAVTFDALADALVTRYRAEQRPTLKNLITRLKPLRTHFGSRKAVSITTSDMAAYAARRRDVDKAAIATVNLEIAFASRAFAVALEDRVLTQAPKFHALPGANVRQGIVEDYQFKDIVALMPEDLAPYAWFLRLTGWRRSEPARLRWANVSWEANDLLLVRSKNKKPRRLPFAKYAALHSLLVHQRERCFLLQQRLGIIVEWVFPRSDGRPTKDDAFYRAWAKARAIAGYPDAKPHDLRRSIARKGEMSRTPRGVTMALMGVTTQAVFQRYAVLTQTDLEDGLGDFSEAQEPESKVSKFRREG